MVLLCYSHVLSISFASVRSTPFLPFIVPIFAWNFPLVSNFHEEIYSLSHSIVFLFLCIDRWGKLSYLFLLFSGTLHSSGYIFPFLLCLYYRGLECKSRKSRDNWSTGNFGLGIQNETGQRLTEFCQENILAIENTLFQRHKRSLYTRTSLDGQYQSQTDYILCSQNWISSVQSTKTRPRADCDLDHEFLIAKFRLKLKKVGKTTRPFRYDLNQILYDYTVEVTNRFKGLDLTDRVPEELWTEVCDTVQEGVIKTIPKKKKCTKAKWMSHEASQIAVKRREAKGKGEKERYTHLNADFQ